VRRFFVIIAIAAIVTAQAEILAQPSLSSGSVLEAAERLKAGEYLWAPEVAPTGPVLLVVSLATQRAVIYRNGIPIGISTVSTGQPGYRTPTGVFTVLQRHIEHYSNLYNNAPMPYMQRLTWGGVALHGGNIPGYPASHGCVRLPQNFARLLYGVTRLGMTVIITNQSVVPRIAPAETLLRPGSATSTSEATWHPELSPSGPVSIVISAADQRLIVLRDGIVVGQSPVTIDGAITRTSAYVLRAAQGTPQSWLRIGLPGQEGLPDEASELRGRIHVPEGFRRAVGSILRPGTTVVITQDSLRGGSAGSPLTVLEGDNRP